MSQFFTSSVLNRCILDLQVAHLHPFAKPVDVPACDEYYLQLVLAYIGSLTAAPTSATIPERRHLPGPKPIPFPADEGFYISWHSTLSRFLSCQSSSRDKCGLRTTEAEDPDFRKHDGGGLLWRHTSHNVPTEDHSFTSSPLKHGYNKRVKRLYVFRLTTSRVASTMDTSGIGSTRGSIYKSCHHHSTEGFSQHRSKQQRVSTTSPHT